MGEFDIFTCTYDPEANTFGPVENLGYPINDINNDLFFVLNLDGKRGYYSSERSDTRGYMDLYEIDTRFKPKELAVQCGKVSVDSLPLRAKIEVYEIDGKLLQGVYTSNLSTGNFVLALNPYRAYKVSVEAEGYETLELRLEPMVNRRDNPDLVLKLKKRDSN